MTKKVNVAIVGLNFGALFVPSYKFHPNVGELTICDLNRELVSKVGDRLDIQKRYYSFDDVLNDETIDAVHLLTNIPDHDKQAVAVLEAGKHCASAVPMSLTMEGIYNIIAAKEKSGKKYMLMETNIFTRNYLYAQQMIDSGEMGNVQFIRGAHYQDMEGWPRYWRGMPPMFYASHALAPAYAAVKGRATRVVCFGTGKMRDELHVPYGNPFPIETALYEMENGTAVEITRSLFANARPYTESWTIYGEKASFETGQLDSDLPYVFRYVDKGIFDPNKPRFSVTDGREISVEKIDPPDRLALIPNELHKLTRPQQMVSLTDPNDIYEYSSIGGFHPHVVNEFILSLVEERKPFFDVYNSANLTAANICAHESAMLGGREVVIPEFKK